MIDAGNSEEHAQLFLEMLKEQNVSHPDFVALTHWHWDHILDCLYYKMHCPLHILKRKRDEYTCFL